MPTLLISRDRLREGPLRVEGSLELPGDWGPDGFELRAPPRVDVVAEEAGDGSVRIRGSLAARMQDVCSRCLATVEREREVGIDLRFEPELDAWDEGPGLYVLDADREALEIGPALREELILGLPDYPLCRPDCRGLCPSCGTDWNESDCECAAESSDPRWESLRRQLAPEGPHVRDDEQQDG